MSDIQEVTFVGGPVDGKIRAYESKPPLFQRVEALDMMTPWPEPGKSHKVVATITYWYERNGETGNYTYVLFVRVYSHDASLCQQQDTSRCNHTGLPAEMHQDTMARKPVPRG